MVGNVEFLIGKTNGCSLWFVDCLASDEAALGYQFKQDMREKLRGGVCILCLIDLALFLYCWWISRRTFFIVSRWIEVFLEKKE